MTKNIDSDPPLAQNSSNIRDAQETAQDAYLLKRFKVVQMIGTGNYSRVYKCFTNSGKEVAIKAINLTKNSDNYTKKFLPRELSVLKRINHVNICKTHEIIQIADRIYVLMPFCQRGTIADLLVKTGPLSESVCRFMFVQVLEAIVYLHSMEIAHRDVKVENILLTSDWIPKLTDFSYSTFTTTKSTRSESPRTINQKSVCATAAFQPFKSSIKTVNNPVTASRQTTQQTGTETNPNTIFKAHPESPKGTKNPLLYHKQSAMIKTLMNKDNPIRLNDTFCGTLPYLAPEVIRLTSYDAKKVDVWSLGVCLFVMMNDKLPFGFDDIKKMVKKQTSRDYKFRPGHEPSEQLKDMLSLIFEPDYTRRLDSRELSRHAWLIGPMEKPNVT